MSLLRLIRQNLQHYRSTYLLVLAGTIICSGILTGSLTLGDSVSGSLQEQVKERLGKTDYVITRHNSYFPADYATRLQEQSNKEIAPLLQLSGSASAPETGKTISGVSLNGVDKRFWKMGNSSPRNIERGTVVVNRQLAEQLDLAVNDHLILRIQKPSYVHFNIPFTSDSKPYVSLRLEVAEIISGGDFGNFNLKNDQKLPANIFLSLDDLSDRTEIPGQANKLLLNSDDPVNREAIDSLLQAHQTPKDLNISLRYVAATDEIAIRYKPIFMSDTLVQLLKELHPEAQAVYTYLANTLQKEGKRTPYSFVSSLNSTAFDIEIDTDSSPYPIHINTWLADDLNAKAGDTLLISYFVSGVLRELQEDSALFIVDRILPMAGLGADSLRMPQFPGIANVDRCSNWEAGIPMDFSRIREKDETYWERFRGTPKAYIPYPVAQELWGTQYGSATSIRLPRQIDTTYLINTLLKTLSPALMGFGISAAKEEALTASEYAVDFAELFLGLSFFLQLAALLVIGLLFSLSVQMRNKEQGILLAMGFTQKKVFSIFFLEAIAIALIGAFVGIFASLLFNYGILHLLNSIWYDIVRTPAITLHIIPKTLLTGFLISFAAALAALSFSLYRSLKNLTRNKQLINRQSSPHLQRKISIRVLTLALVTTLSSVLILLRVNWQAPQQDANLFFLLGGLVLISLSSFAAYVLNKPQKPRVKNFSFLHLSFNKLRYNKGQHISMLTAMALATFLVLSIGMYRTGLGASTQDRNSGTGGFLYYIETAIPVAYDLNSEAGREEQGLYALPDQIRFIQMPLYDGDEANCLNLHRILRPRVLGLDPDEMIKRSAFLFVNTRQNASFNNAWELLHMDMGEQCVPAIADQTVIQWSLGKSVGDSITYTNEQGKEIHLVLVAGLANSVFQGNLLIAEEQFNHHFQGYRGTRVLLVEAPEEQADQLAEELHYGLAPHGAIITPTTERMESFNSVTNTYLDIFLLLGGIALILSTLGIAILVYAGVQKQSHIYAMMEVLGISKQKIHKQVLTENMILLGAGVLIGGIAAITALLPGLSQQAFGHAILPAVSLISLLLINGLVWIRLSILLSLHKKLIKNLRNE